MNSFPTKLLQSVFIIVAENKGDHLVSIVKIWGQPEGPSWMKGENSSSSSNNTHTLKELTLKGRKLLSLRTTWVNLGILC